MLERPSECTSAPHPYDAEVAGFRIDDDVDGGATRAQKLARITAALDRGQPTMVYQPLVSLADMHLVGLECLARFAVDPYRAPDHWFAEAADVGQGAALELQAIRNGLDGLRGRRVPDDIRIWLNASARTIIDSDVSDHFQGFAPDRIVLELTQHEQVDDYPALGRALQPLRERGVSVAIDDTGAGFSSMSHLFNIVPEVIKLDTSLTRNIDIDRKRRALAAALIAFGRQTRCRIVAEGVESVAQLNALRDLGVHMGQGYFISGPIGADAFAGNVGAFATLRG